MFSILKILVCVLITSIGYNGADPGFSERGLGQTPDNITLELLLNKSFFNKKKYGKNICVSLQGVQPNNSNHP